MRDKPDLSDVGGWEAARILPSQHRLIRHAYEQTVDACARLASFATGTPTRTSGPINERQEALAVEDLIAFAIHARRLVGNTTQSKRISTVEMMVHGPKATKKPKSLYKVINVLVHNDRIEICRTEARRLTMAGAAIDELIPIFAGQVPNRSFPPLVVISSPKERPIVFELRHMIEVFQNKVLEAVIDFCAEQNLFLDETDSF